VERELLTFMIMGIAVTYSTSLGSQQVM
jgi:hypothetical protein